MSSYVSAADKDLWLSVMNKTVIREDGKVVYVNAYDIVNGYVFDVDKGTGKNYSLAVSLSDIKKGKAFIQEQLFY